MLLISFIIVFDNLLSIALGVYNTEVYIISSHSQRTLFRTDRSKLLLFENVGLATLEVKIHFGLKSGTRDGEQKIIEPGGFWKVNAEFCAFCRWVGFLVTNNHETKGQAHAFAVDEGFPEYDPYAGSPWDLNTLTQLIVSTGVAHVPVISDFLIVGVNFFWPQNQPSVWDEIKDKVLNKINEKISDQALETLQKELSSFRQKIKNCAREIDSPNVTTTVAAHYGNIAEDLIGLERKFMGGSNLNLNFNALPLLSAVINLKMYFYKFGIKNRERIGLDKEFDGRLRYYIFDMIYNTDESIIDYIIKTCEDKLDWIYRNVGPDVMFTDMSGARQYCALNSLEFMHGWKIYAKDALAPKPTKMPILVYSNQYGRNSARQIYEIIALESKTFSPKIIHGEINQISYVDVVVTSNNYIAGLEVYYENGDNEFTGATRSGNHGHVDFNGKRLVNLTAFGTGQINVV